MKPCLLFRFRRAAVLIFSTGYFLTAGCARKGPDPDDVPVAPSGGLSRVGVEQGTPVVRLSPAEIGAIGLKAIVLKNADHHPLRPAFGVLLDPQSLAASASALAEAQSRAQKAGAALAASAAEHQRAKRLHEDGGNLSAREFEASEAAWRSDQAAVAAAQSALRLAKTAARQQWGPVLAGWMGQRGGDYQRLENGDDVLLRVAFPGGVPAPPPASADITLPGGQRAKATFLSAASQASSEFQSAALFFVAKAGPNLLPGLSVNVLLPAAGPDTTDVDLPAEAVLHWQGRIWVYVQMGPGTFSRREIPSNVPDGEGGYLAADFPTAKPVVIRGAAALLSEEFKPASSDTD